MKAWMKFNQYWRKFITYTLEFRNPKAGSQQRGHSIREPRAVATGSNVQPCSTDRTPLNYGTASGSDRVQRNLGFAACTLDPVATARGSVIDSKAPETATMRSVAEIPCLLQCDDTKS